MIASKTHLARHRWGIMHIQLVPLITAVAELVAALTAMYGVIRGIPVFRDRVHLAHEAAIALSERDSALQREREARAAADAYRLSSEGWKAAVEQMCDEMRSMKRQFASAIVYIGSVIGHVRSGGGESGLPPIPAELEEALQESLRQGGSFYRPGE